MKILFWLGIGFDRHGPSVHLLKEMIEECLIAGHDVVMIVRRTGGVDPNIPLELQKYDHLICEVVNDKEQKKNALVRRYFEDIRYFFRCRSILKKHRDTDVVFLQSCTAPIFPIQIVHRILKKPVLFNVQNIFPNDALALGKLSLHGIKGIAFHVFRKMQRIAYEKAESIVTISEDMKKTLIGEGVPEKKIRVIYNWSYSDDEIEIEDNDNLFLQDHKDEKEKFRVVFAGNLGAMVNVNLFAEAAKELKSQSDIQFIIIGGGNNMSCLQRLAEENNLSNMSFYTYQPESYAKHNYAMANVNINALPRGIIYTCMPSKTATMLNSARPMVVAVEKDSDYAGMLGEVDLCTVVDVDDVQGFVNAILEFYNNKDLRHSNNARVLFKKYCSCKNAQQYVNALEDMSRQKLIK